MEKIINQLFPVFTLKTNKQTNKNAVTEKPGDTSFLSTRTNKKIK